MIKTVELSGAEQTVTGLDKNNTLVINNSDGSVFASNKPGVEAYADGVIEIPAGAHDTVVGTNGTVYVLGKGRVELRGIDYVGFKRPSSLNKPSGGGGVEDVTKAYVDAQDGTNLGAAKAYTDTAVNAVKDDVSDNTESISAVRTELTAAQTDIAANTAAAANNSKDISVLQADVAAATENIDNNLMTVNGNISDLQKNKADRSEIPSALPANGGNAATVNGYTVDANVPANAKFTDTTYENASKTSDGLMSKEDKARVDGMLEEINTVASNKVAEIVANAPEDLDTLKEIADWINGHQESAAAMNTQIQTNSTDISALQTTKADKSELPTTLPADGGNADTVNGHTVDADVPANAKFTDTTYSAMTGATETAAGKAGLVPTPPKNSQQHNFLKANGQFANPLNPISITTADTDLNDYKTSGVYFFSSSYTPLHVPDTLVNGWLIVIKYNDYLVKQILLRGGTANSNDFNTYVRTYTTNVWGDWKRFATEVDMSQKMNKENPTGTGAFSMNRKIDSIVGDHSFAEGFNTAATNDRAHAEGHTTQANGLQAHSEGYYTEANGHASHTEGAHTSTVNNNAHAEGSDTCAGGKSSHAEGYHSYTDPAHDGAHAEGGYCTAEGQASHAQGWATYAEQNYSFAAGQKTKTGRVCDTVLGLLNLPNSNSLLTIGFGSGGNADLVDQELTGKEYNDYAREGATLKNVFRVDTSGKVYGVGAFNTSGADYAEYIKPWFDGNAENEDRRGYFVTVKDGRLYKAEPDDYIVGITSGNPSVVGNGDEDWLGRWQRDEFNELVYQDVEVDDYGEIEDENGNTVSVKIGSHIEKQTVEVPEYDSSQRYIERKDRPEWSHVGMIGVIPLRDDGTCAAGGFAKCGAGGIATAAAEWECHKTFFVIERINDHIISVEMR